MKLLRSICDGSNRMTAGTATTLSTGHHVALVLALIVLSMYLVMLPNVFLPSTMAVWSTL